MDEDITFEIEETNYRRTYHECDWCHGYGILDSNMRPLDLDDQIPT